MTKIAHPQREHEQDDAAVKRDEEKLTRIARATEKAGDDVARANAKGADRTADAVETTRKLAKKSPEFGLAFKELLEEQTRQSVDAFSAFARAVNWTDVAQAQSKLMAGSFSRFSQFSASYGEFLLRGMTAAPTLPRR